MLRWRVDEKLLAEAIGMKVDRRGGRIRVHGEGLGHGPKWMGGKCLEFLYITPDRETRIMRYVARHCSRPSTSLLTLMISDAVRIVLWGVQPYSLSWSNVHA